MRAINFIIKSRIYCSLIAFLLMLGTTNVWAISVSPSPSYTSALTVSWTNSTSGSSSLGNMLQIKSGSGAWTYVSTSAGATSKYYSSSGTTTHQFRIQNKGCVWGTCWDTTVEGPVSVQVLFPSVLSTPTGPSTDNNGAYTISWGTSTGAVRYQVQQRISGGSWTTYNTGTAKSKAFSGNGNYVWQYRARGCAITNYTRCASWSGTKSVTVAITPGVPSLASISPSTSYTGSHTISWGASSGSFTNYQLYRSYNGGGYTYMYTGTSRSRSYTGLADGTYRYRVRAYKTVSSYTSYSGYRYSNTATVSNIPTTPGTPSISDGSTSTDGAYTVSWTGSSGAVTSYRLEERVNGGSWVQVQSSMALSKAFSGKGNASYAYRVRACGASGCSGYSGTGSVTVLLPPGVPGAISAPSSSTTGIYTVSWGAASGTVTSYTLEEQFNGGSWTVAQNTSALSKAFSGKGDGSYNYRVKACNSSGCSSTTASAMVTVLLSPGAPGQIIISDANDVYHTRSRDRLMMRPLWERTSQTLLNGLQEVSA